jgi:NitT/TauT family transport system substrate-binding protein
MRKLFVLISITLLFGLSACIDANNEVIDQKEEVSFKVIAPIGTPALAQTYIQSTLPSLGEHVTYEIETISGTDPLVAAFTSGSHDIIYAPTNLGAKLISTGLEYKFAGTVVWGNLYLATTGLDNFTLADLEGKEIVAFGQNATPDVVLQTVLNNFEFTVAPTIRYVDSVTTAQAELLQDNSKIVLMAEPALSVLGLPTKIGEELDVLSLQEEWKNVTGTSSYPMAGIFVKSSLNQEVVDAYLSQVEISISEANTDPAKIATMSDQLGYGLPVPVVTNAIPRSNLQFVNALDSRKALEEYFGYIMDLNSALIGGSLPSDDFYYRSE